MDGGLAEGGEGRQDMSRDGTPDVRLPWAGPTLAAAAFAAVFAMFAWQLCVYRQNVRAASERDLQSRAELAAIVLAEPLKTLDFRAIRDFGEQCRVDGLRLRICQGPRFFVSEDAQSGRTGFYDTMGGDGRAYVFKAARSGDCWVGMGRPAWQVFAPFAAALVVIVLAGLVGVVGVVLFFFAIWRQRVRIRALARMERFRREFVADVSHEIKTPLTGIIGAAEMMEHEAGKRGDGGAMATLAHMVGKESRRLNALVRQILDLSRLEREGMRLDIEDTDLSELVRETVGRFHAMAEAARVVVSVSAPPGGVHVRCDGALVAQALGNLVENAIRHSGSPTVVVSCAADGKGVRLAVEDCGCGIPPKEMPRVFERFHRVDVARSADTGGSGLGLAIVRRIARLHGGEVGCEPVAPHGVRFTMCIPSAKP